MGSGARVRTGFLGLNLALVAGVGLLLREVLAPAPLEHPRGTPPLQLAIEAAPGGPGEAGRFQPVWEQLDRPRPTPPPQAAPSAAPANGALEAAWDLLCVLVDQRDPFRCSAIVGGAGGGAQASLGPGDAFGGGTVAGIEVEDEPAGRRARVRVRLPDSVQTLELWMPRDAP